MAERTAEFILGLFGGIIGLLAVPGLVLLGAAIIDVPVGTQIFGWGIGGGILSIVGLIGAAFVKSRPKISGAIMLACGILGLFVALGLWVGALLLVVAGIVALIRKGKPRELSAIVPPQSYQSNTPASVAYCHQCGRQTPPGLSYCGFCGAKL